MSFLSEYKAELHSYLRATSQSHTPAALELPLRECYSVLNVSDVLHLTVLITSPINFLLYFKNGKSNQYDISALLHHSMRQIIM